MSAADVRRELLAIASEAPPNPYAFPRTYVVRNGRTDGKLDLDPPADARGVLPSLAGAPVWGAPGMSVQALPGDRVIVVFRDARSDRPAVVGFEPLSTGRHPKVTLDADALVLCGTTDALVVGAEVTSRRVVCYGDQVTLPVVGAAAVGALIQNPATTPNAISKVRV